MNSEKFMVLPCVCPECGSDLRGLPNDGVFFCNNCRVAVEFETGVPVQFKVRFIAPNITSEGEKLYLPFWQIHFSTRFSGKDAKQIARAEQAQFRRVLIAGCKMHGYLLYGDLSLLLSYDDPQTNPDAHAYPVSGCRRTSEQAKKRLHTLLLAMIDKKVDITGLEVRTDITDISILGIPFFDFKDYLIDGLTGRKILSRAFDDLSAIRRNAKIKI